jgi:hypothetical protein
MTLKIEPEVAKKKIDEFLPEVESLLKLNHRDGQEKYYALDTRIRNFASTTFTDSKEKIQSMAGVYIAVVGYEKSEVEEQKEYIDELNRKKRHILAWKEEVELVMESLSQSNKVSKVEQEIKEADLEAARREKVAESKFFGAVIELLDIQRNLIKDKEQTTKKITEIQNDISDLKSMFQKILEKKVEETKA